MINSQTQPKSRPDAEILPGTKPPAKDTNEPELLTEAEPADKPFPEAENDGVREPAAESQPANAGGAAAEAQTEPVSGSRAEGASEPARAGSGRKLGAVTRRRIVAAVVAAALAGAGAAVVMLWREAGVLEEERSARQAVALAASSFGEALLGYDYANLQAARDGVLSRAGDDFAKTYDEAFTGGLEGVITQLKARAVATCRDAYVGEVGDGRAKVIVVCDAQVTSSAGTRRMLGTYLEEKLIWSGGRWLVDEVNAIGASDETLTDPDGRPRAEPSPSASGG
ncbi:hypothetical protein Acor_16680 [Acrocarpospora corrugata]|uniref:SnoaL-like domain-containing protein n=1 Tax=Acrocarpospora corrugata TaxID=35763 RepID=A0A5M3VS61_9ACTN|nr:hypothetical protein [Acrocarpospora corrugata]GER99604.1 hypothetical protein Acor_16680 [Acrocarpospora corrugata]